MYLTRAAANAQDAEIDGLVVTQVLQSSPLVTQSLCCGLVKNHRTSSCGHMNVASR